MTPKELTAEIIYRQFIAAYFAYIARCNLEELIDTKYDNYGIVGPWIKDRCKRQCIEAQEEAAINYAAARRLMGLE